MSFLPKLPRVKLALEDQPLDIDIALASRFLERLRGLILTGPVMPTRALMIAPCNSIHTLGMRGQLEAVFLSKDLRVLKISPPLKPWRGMSICPGAWAVLEWRVGEAAYLGLRQGSQLKQIDPQEALLKESAQ